MEISITHDLQNDIALRWFRFTLYAKRVAWSDLDLRAEVKEMREWCGENMPAMPTASKKDGIPTICFANVAEATSFKMRWT